MNHLSPLRYPGGKNKIYKEVLSIIQENNFQDKKYVEPFAGGASLALRLLYNNDVKNIHINDYDISIYALWYTILNLTDELISLINNTSITVKEWKKQKKIQINKENASLLELGFSTLFLNRTNRSGILNAGPIGGYEQKGNYSIDCRFNKIRLIKQINIIHSFKDKITISNLDAKILISQLNNQNTFLYLDPPYYEKGHMLYLNSFNHDDHKHLSDIIQTSKHYYIASYDNVIQILKMYQNNKIVEFNLSYSLANKKKKSGKEIMIFGNNVTIPKKIFI